MTIKDKLKKVSAKKREALKPKDKEKPNPKAKKKVTTAKKTTSKATEKTTKKTTTKATKTTAKKVTTKKQKTVATKSEKPKISVSMTKAEVTGAIIKDAMARKKLTQEKLAKMVGTTPYMISQFQNGKQSPKKKFIPKLEEVLGIELSGDIADIKAAAGDAKDLQKQWQKKIIDNNAELKRLGVEVVWLNKTKGHYYYSTVENPYDSANVERKALARFNKKRRKNYKTWKEATEGEIPLSKQLIKEFGEYLHWAVILTHQDLTNEPDDFIWKWNNHFRMLAIGIINPTYDFDLEVFIERWEEVKSRRDPAVIKRRKAFRKGQKRKEKENLAQSK